MLPHELFCMFDCRFIVPNYTLILIINHTKQAHFRQKGGSYAPASAPGGRYSAYSLLNYASTDRKCLHYYLDSV